MAAAGQVLLTPGLMATVSSFQRGLYQDMQTFRAKLCPVYASMYDASVIRTLMPHTRAILDPWLRAHGVQRIPKAVAVCLKLRQVFVQYAVYFGDVALAKYLHGLFDLHTFTEPLLDLAALNGQLDMLQYLQRIGHKGLTSNAKTWAAKYEHANVVKYLYQRRDPTKPRAVTSFPAPIPSILTKHPSTHEPLERETARPVRRNLVHVL